MFIETETTPNPATLKFLPGRAVMAGGTANFVDADAATTHDSARIFSSRTVLRMRTSARRFTKPGSGTTRSMMRS